MTVTIISTPVHDAIGITSVPASVEAEACRNAQIDFAAFLTDADLLTLALYGSHPSVCAQYLEFPEGDYRKDATEKATALHLNPCKISQLASEGFFNRQLHSLLEIGNYNSDYGAKLVPVFTCMLEHASEHHLDASLIEDIQRFLAKRDFVDGFIIIDQTAETCSVMPGLWGRKGVA